MRTLFGHRRVCQLPNDGLLLGLIMLMGLMAPRSASGQEPVPAARGEVKRGDTSGSAEARRWIRALGADSYATRTQARDRLRRMGLEAVDELRKAENDLDYEVALSARALLTGYSIAWFADDDPPLVRAALEGYGAEEELERQSRIVTLSELPERMGLQALVRITRYERSAALSRKAAIEIIGQAMNADSEKRKANAELVSNGLASAKRDSVEWLRVYAGDLLSGEYSTDVWRALIRSQRDEVDALASEKRSRESVLGLVRTCALHAASMGNQEEGLRLAIENADLVPASTTGLVEASNWAIDNDLHGLVFELYSKNRPMFNRSPVLLYGYAKALSLGGDEVEAERIAELAFRKNPLTGTKEAISEMQPWELEENARLRRELAEMLRERGMFPWAEREYRSVVDSMPLDDLNTIVVRGSLSMMYRELERHQDVVDLLGPVVERMSKDEAFRMKIMTQPRLGPFVSSWKSLVAYHTALLELEMPADNSAAEEANREKARQRMLAAFQDNRSDIDILIKMYRTEGDEEWRRVVKAQLARAIRNAETGVINAEADMKRMPNQNSRINLAAAFNNYAWLVCNTEGDLELALEHSLSSLKLIEDSAKLDTCGRCYFAVGDFDNAIRMQKRALGKEPHSPPLKRQLAEFEAAKAKADAAKNK